MANPEEGKRDMRMDARVSIRKGEEQANIEIQRVKKDDEAARALFYSGGLVTNFPKGTKRIPETKNTVIFICDFDPFEGTPYEGQTRMKFTLKSDDDENKFHTLTDRPYPFEGLTIIIYNGAQDWEKNPPKSEEEEERIRVYLEDMKNTDPKMMTSEIARTACRNYKGDPRVVDKVKDWIVYKYGEELEEELAAHKKEFDDRLEAKQKEFDAILESRQREFDERLESQKKDFDEKLESRQKDFDEKLESQQKDFDEKLESRQREYNEKLEEGLNNQIEEIARNLLSIGMDDEAIIKATNIPLERVKELRKTVIEN